MLYLYFYYLFRKVLYLGAVGLTLQRCKRSVDKSLEMDKIVL